MSSNRLSLVKLATVGLLLTAMAGCVGTVEESIKTSCGSAAAVAAPDDLLVPSLTAPSSVRHVLAAQPALDEPLKLGTMLPITGSLQAFGDHMQKAAQLAVKQINAAGGVNGMPVELVLGDTKTSPTEAATGFTNLVNQGVAGVAGAASSGVTGAILPLAIDNEIFLFTPASTSPALTESDNQGWFGRVPPSDALQGKVLAAMVAEDGCQTVAVMAVQNAYGQGLGQVFKQSFESRGGTVVETIMFEEKGATYASQVTQAGKQSPDAIVFIGYPEEGGQIVKEAFQKGLMSKSVFFFSEGVKDGAFVEQVGKDSAGNFVLTGLGGTAPDAAQTAATQAFKDAFMAEYGAEPKLFSAETYDAIMAMALTAAYAGDHSGTAIRDNLHTVYNAPGTRVSAADLPAAFLAAHAKQDVNYVGASNDFDLDPKGDPSTGVYSYWRVADDGSIMSTRQGITPS